MMRAMADKPVWRMVLRLVLAFLPAAATPAQAAQVDAGAGVPLNVAFIWHQHQPLYTDPATGDAILPWVRMHAVKDYYDMAAMLEQYPSVRATFNLVPSLIDQLLAYYDGEPRDAYQRAALIPANQLSDEDKAFLLRRFFDANWDKVISRFPRYRELLEKRGADASDAAIAAAMARFTEQDYRDLQVWFDLAWFDPDFLETDADLAALVRRGRDFSEADKQVIREKQTSIIREVLPVHRRLQERGQIEIITAPYAHPILPLLYSTETARIASPDLPLPQPGFSYADDIRRHLARAVETYRTHFGRDPLGLWPSEQAVSKYIVPYVAQAGFRWMVSSEGVLAKSLGVQLRGLDGTVVRPDLLYQPYLARWGGAEVAILFRDIHLSDKVGFEYSGMGGADAAADLIAYLHQVRRALGDAAGEKVVVIALDGENAWEHYDNDGKEFFHALYGALAEDPLLRTVTVSEYLAAHPPTAVLEDLWTGSWISDDLETWIGEREENTAWQLLAEARAVLSAYEAEHGGDPAQAAPEAGSAARPENGSQAGRGVRPEAGLEAGPEAGRKAGPEAEHKAGPEAGHKAGPEEGPEARPWTGHQTRNIAAAWEAMLAAEGSDWFWWYGSDQDSGNDAAFDQLFRSHLRGVYEALGMDPPARLYRPIVAPAPARADRPVSGLSAPLADGWADFQEWDAAARYDAPSDGAVMRVLYVAVDTQYLTLRVDFHEQARRLVGLPLELLVYLDHPAREMVNDTTRYSAPGPGMTALGFGPAYEVRLDLATAPSGLRPPVVLSEAAGEGAWIEVETLRQAGLGGVLEVRLPWEQLGIDPGDPVRVVAVLVEKDTGSGARERERLPVDGPAEVFRPRAAEGRLVFRMEDPGGDDYGPGTYTYPLNAVFEPGVFDMTGFEVYETENDVLFHVQFAGPVNNVWNSPNGLSVQTIDIYIDTVPGSGSTEALGGRRVRIAPDSAWEHAIWVEGWHQRLFQADGTELPVRVRAAVDPVSRRVTIQVPKAAIGSPEPGWGYTVLVLGQEGFPASDSLRVREVMQVAQEWRFGGGHDGPYDPNVIDLLAPAGEQERMLSGYDPERGVLADVHAVRGNRALD